MQAAVWEEGDHPGGLDPPEVPDLPIEIRPNTESKLRVLIRFEKVFSDRALFQPDHHFP